MEKRRKGTETVRKREYRGGVERRRRCKDKEEEKEKEKEVLKLTTKKR